MTVVVASEVGRALAAVPALVTLGLLAAYARRDARWLLVVFVALLFVFTPRLVVGALGAGGTPAALAAAVGTVWWGADRALRPTGLARGRQPIRIAVFAHGWVMALGYIIAISSPTTTVGLNGAHRALVWLVTVSGLALLAADGLSTRAHLDALLSALVVAATFMGLVGLIQSFTGQDPATALTLPGLVENSDVNHVLGRAGLHRPAGTATHPIELGVVMATILPLAAHRALQHQSRAVRRLSWVAAGVIALALALSLSRSALLGLTVAGLVLARGWSWRWRLNAIVGGVLGLALLRLAMPRLLRTLRNLFTNASDDPSILARIDRVERVREIVGDAPWFGHGYGVHSIEDYLLLDNQVFLTLIESGVVGLAAVAGLFATGLWTAVTTRRAAGDDETRHLAQALLAALSVPLLTFATFDLLKFRVIASLLFLLLGCVGALWRLTVTAGPAAPAAPAAPERELVHR